LAIKFAGARPFDNRRNLDLNISLVWPPISIILPVFYSLKQVLFVPIIYLAILRGGLADLVDSLGTSNEDE
jgi:hypothetical protein